MESYIVRIYRQDITNPHNMAGIVVKASDDTETRFTSSGELIDLLSQLEETSFQPHRPLSAHMN